MSSSILEKAYSVRVEVTPQQILMWANSILMPSSLQVRAGENVYRVELRSGLIARKSKNGKVYKDSRKLLS